MRMEAGGIEPKEKPTKQANTMQDAPLAIRNGAPLDIRVRGRTQKDKEYLRSAHQLRADTSSKSKRFWPASPPCKTIRRAFTKP